MSAIVALETDAFGLPWEVFICRACGLLYDESQGDEDSGLAAGTRFADIPDDWACPLCGVRKSDFELYVDEAPVRQPRRSPQSRTASPQRASARGQAGTVIVGAGRAGWQMAQALRSRDTDMPITLVTSCKGDVYDKPLLSVALARGIALEKMPREQGFEAASRLRVKLLAHTQAVSITPSSRQAVNCALAVAPCTIKTWCWRMAQKPAHCRSCPQRCAGASTTCRLMPNFAAHWAVRLSALQ